MPTTPGMPMVVWIMLFERPPSHETGQFLHQFQDTAAGGRTTEFHMKSVRDTEFAKLEIETDPIHPLVKSNAGTLSQVHKSDYMKAYLMHHYGGGYTEALKGTTGGWVSSFAAFDNPHTWAVGVNNFGPNRTATVACGSDYLRFLGINKTCADIRRGVRPLIRTDAFIMRPKTPLTRAWLRAANWRLDYKEAALRASPPPSLWCCRHHNRTIGYPLSWNELRGDILNPLVDKYLTHVRRALPRPLEHGHHIKHSHAHAAQHWRSKHHDDTLVLKKPYTGHGVVTATGVASGSQTVPVMVWTLWFGEPMRGHRLKAFRALEASLGVPVRLIQEDEIASLNKSHDPIHPAIFSGTMSAIQQGDYMRAYIMHHYGGGYTDIKPTTRNWSASFDEFKDPSLWMLGVKEIAGGVACGGHYLKFLGIHASCGDVTQQWETMVTNGAYIIRPGSPISEQWLKAANWRLDQTFERLKRHPAPFQRCCLGNTDAASRAYPLRWADLHGEIMGPLQYRFLMHIKQGLPHWAAGSYRESNEGTAR